jgi:glycosyltransferase involved in cell wall biosynthesis
MDLLFVSGTTVGGSGRSQRELAAALARRGHRVRFLVDDKQAASATRWLHGQLSDLSVRWSGRPGARIADWARSRPGRRWQPVEMGDLPHVASPVPQNALASVLSLWRPHAVVVSSVERWAWRLIHQSCAQHGVPSVLYVREDDSLTHLDTGALPDLLLANAESLTRSLRSRGFACTFLPSAVDTSLTRTESSRRTALAINPVPSRGGDLVWQVAARLPDIPFVVQESWPLKPADLAVVHDRVARLPNVEFRRASPPGPGLYGDARVLLVPYRVDNRPRVILEAQANGIPAVVGDVPSLIEAAGPAGVTVPLESVDDWVEAIDCLWHDADRYGALVSAARGQAERSEVQPDVVAERFEGLLADLAEPRV